VLITVHHADMRGVNVKKYSSLKFDTAGESPSFQNEVKYEILHLIFRLLCESNFRFLFLLLRTLLFAVHLHLSRGLQIASAKSPGQLNFVRLRLLFVSP
jgi:hypothetical protein